MVAQRARALAFAARSGLAPLRAPGSPSKKARLPADGAPCRARFRVQPNHRTLLMTTIMPISIGFTIAIYVLEVVVAIIQAYIFTLLTAVFIGMAVEEHDHH